MSEKEYIKGYGLTRKERELLDALDKHESIKEAAKALGISENAAYQRLLRIRGRYYAAKKIVEEVEKYREKGRKFQKVLYYMGSTDDRCAGVIVRTSYS